MSLETVQISIQYIDMKYFTMSEMCKSTTAILHHISNYPQQEEIFENIRTLVDKVLDPARELLCEPIYVNSGYRSPQVNKMVGGVKNSQHMKGQAADVYCKNMTKLWNILKHLEFDQLIMYKNKNFYHVSYNEGHNRKQILYI